MTKKLIYTALIVLVSFAAFLFFQLSKDKGKKNGFNRTFENSSPEFVKLYQLPPSLFFFAGNSENEIFLKDLRYSVADLYSIDYSLSKFKREDLREYLIPTSRTAKVNIGIIDTATYITEEQTGKLTTVSKNSNRARSFKVPNIWIDQTKLFSNRSLIGRGMVLKNKQPELNLTKLNYLSGKIEKTYVLKSNKNNFFSADGSLQYDRDNSQLIFLYYYSGDFVCLDTNLNTVYKATTIDKSPYTEVKLAKLNKKIGSQTETNVTQAAPTKVINRSFTLYKQHLYILSTLKADNESDSDFKKNQVIDVYAISTGKYKYSFYIPKYQGKKLRTIIIANNYLYGIFGSLLVKYKLA